MKKKLTLDNDNTQLHKFFGISTPLIDYKLAWNINNAIEISLKRLVDFDYSSDIKKEPEHFSNYYFKNIPLNTEYFIISNKSESANLIPEFKQIDYLFIIKSENINRLNPSLTNKIKNIDNIQTVFAIDLSKIKHINNLISDLELHLLKLKSN